MLDWKHLLCIIKCDLLQVKRVIMGARKSRPDQTRLNGSQHQSKQSETSSCISVNKDVCHQHFVTCFLNMVLH